ncbi:P-loop containing nucleoside triphosphate hydrolase protein [Macrophomina phaseolina]|uniref:Ribosome-releasing factor 2, mitochondrial n=1 Tax=Macrophomina phaseolina TaxID=35725 RepID=A0ABQ8GR66_9PEZI|nr:P-loop containing nucleoside triphosphate hydrolase protein [Macrophomina phaseolina]
MILSHAWRAGPRLRNVACARAFHLSVSRRATAQPGTQALENALQRTRNIGIIAHIDAGKTTTTERMLYYSGFTRRLGDVDEGSTVTDFLPAERARGITIQSAAVSFHWPPLSATPDQDASAHSGGKLTLPSSSISHNINLIDTPGHADFTFEVLRSLRILDGAVCILDGVAGVEAQTEQVWKQVNQYQIPRIIFVNKLDRDGAAFERTIKEIGVRLHGWPAVCQIPWWKDGTGKLVGVGDAVHLRGMLWEEGGDGKTIRMHPLEELHVVNSSLAAELKRARIALVELLSEHDDEMVEKFLEYDEDHLAIPSLEIVRSLRRCILQRPQKVIPTYAGASFRNIGVQPLLDAVVDLLPSPEERPDAEVKLGSLNGGLKDLFSGKLALTPPQQAKRGKKAVGKTNPQAISVISKLQACALAFKVVNDNKRGVLVYVRVYSGALTRNTVLFNTNLGISEKVPRLLKMYANDAVEVEEIPAGQIGVIPGLKHARTGDTLIVYTGAHPKVGPPVPINTLQLRPIAVPPPVFFTSVEPHSLSEEKHLTDMLSVLLREDPSLQVSLDSESGQTHLAGMGELHLEIASDRLLNDFKVKASTGAIEIGYREAVTNDSTACTETFAREVAGRHASASCTASVSPLDTLAPPQSGEDDLHITTIPLDSKNVLIINHPTFDTSGMPTSTPDSGSGSLPETLPWPTILHSLKTGASAALARGPTHRFPVYSTTVTITLDPSTHITPDTTPAALSGAARLAVVAALRNAASKSADGNALMEPVMRVTIAVNESDLGAVVHDISSARGGSVLSLDTDTSITLAGNEASAVSPHHAELREDEPLLIDPNKIYAPPDPFGSTGQVENGGSGGSHDRQRQITARVPLKEMVGYLRHLRSLTKGRGTFVMSVDRFERVTGPRLRAVLGEMSGGY